MTSILSVRLLRRWSTAWSLIVVAIPPIGALVALVPLRQWLFPVEESGGTVLFVNAAIALLVPACVGMLMASSFRELRNCPFAWNLPGLPHRASRELRIVGAILFGAMAGFGTALAAGTSVSSWFFATMAALGFTLAIFGNDPPSWALRVRVAVPLLSVFLLVLLAPEVATVTSVLPWLWATGAVGLMIAVVDLTGTATARRDRAARLGAAVRVPTASARLDLYASTSEALRSRRAPRDGAAVFSGVRRSDLDWARAILHEIAGFARGGWVMPMVTFAIAGTLSLLLGLSVIGSLVPLRGMPPEPFGLAWLGSPMGTPRAVITTFLIAMLASMFALSTPLQPPLLVTRPLARVRLARIMWLVTQAQELLMACLAVGVVLLILATARVFGSIDAWPAMRDALASIMAALLVMPAARWWRLQVLDARFTGGGSARPREIDTVMASGTITATTVLGAILCVAFWRSARSLDGIGKAVVVAGSVVAFLALRSAWFFELRRFYARRDL